MTNTQLTQTLPTRDSLVFHANQGCTVRHKTNRVLDECEDRMNRADSRD